MTGLHWRDMASFAPAPKGDEDPFADRRAFPRVTVALPAFLQAGGERHAVQILDVSAGGAKLNCSSVVAAGTAVILDCGTLGRTAVVRWQNGDVLGLCFDSELEAREVNALIKRSSALEGRMKPIG